MGKPGSISDLPSVPAVYALCGGAEGNTYVAYVGAAESLKRRIGQHLINRDSSVTTGVAAARLNPDYVTDMQWWVHPDFSGRHEQETAEWVAFDVLKPILRSRRPPPKSLPDPAFRGAMEELFNGPPTGRLVLPNFQNTLHRIRELEERVTAIEAMLCARPAQSESPDGNRGA